MKNKKGVSTVIASLLLILLTIVLIGVVWSIVMKLVNSKVEESSCLEVIGKVNLNGQYTCYNSPSELRISIEREDIEIGGILVAVSSSGTTKTFTLKEDNQNFVFLKYYNGTYNENVKIPDKNSGRTYVYNLTSQGIGSPDYLSISPIIGENQCDKSDETFEIPDCRI